MKLMELCSVGERTCAAGVLLPGFHEAVLQSPALAPVPSAQLQSVQWARALGLHQALTLGADPGLATVPR